jgi:hypothetical protein
MYVPPSQLDAFIAQPQVAQDTAEYRSHFQHRPLLLMQTVHFHPRHLR